MLEYRKILTGERQTDMHTYEIETMPCVKFAHVYRAASYNHTFLEKENAIEICYISEGSISVFYNGEEHVAQKGDIILLPFDRDSVTVSSDVYHEHHTVFADLKWSRQSGVDGLLLPIITHADYNTKSVANIIDTLIRNRLLFKNSKTKGGAKFLELLCEIDKCNRRCEKSKIPSEIMYARRAKEYVQKNLGVPITQRSVAQYLSISAEYLCSVFKRVEGISFQKYVNHEKLQAIKNLVEKESAYLYEASALLGYSDPNYVSRLFKKYYGYNITDKENRHSAKAE